ncbi:thiol reductant ABC exporter subunit CydC [Marinobacterium arenosum]|uniref:thiol reductant ABC exporter subunit CydC n=1 Tax=Marinobacterium arenosum TaxID=2862496 RepID=UPI001C970C7B|nr:thiol reductant ABC exporter subunit CydC [Marinobacterium arenosum]MBY4675704.1 thiol reductant ABC exporter subunit CydC [Marinobacterium arenosum]
MPEQTISRRESLALLWRLLRLAKPHWRWMALGTLLSLLTLLANIGLLAISGWFLAAMAAAGLAGVTMNYFTPAGVIRFLAIVRTAGRYGERLVTHNATFKLLSELRVWFYRRLEPLAPAGLQGLRHGDLLSRLQADIDALDHFYLRVLLPGLVALVAVPLLLLVIANYDGPLALATGLALLLAGVLIPLWLGGATRAAGRATVRDGARLRAALIDGVQGLRELILYRAADRHAEQCRQFSESLADQQQRINHCAATALLASTLVVGLLVWAALWWLIPQVTSGTRPAVELVMLVLLVMASFEAVQPLPLALEQLSTTLAAARRLFDLADQPPLRPEPACPVELPNSHQLELVDLRFRYSPEQPPLLRGIDLQIEPGEKIALVGASGAGKSTLVQLLLGFWPLEAGQIRLGGQSIDRLPADRLRERFAVVSQHSHLFNATVADNLRLADPTASDEALQQACRAAGIHPLIASLPDGYQTYIGEGGRGLSGGQQRRLAIAQALLKPAPILILDEPTEGLDPITEREVGETLAQAMVDRTVILISHRPALLSHMDRVLLLEDGKLQAEGPHQTLLANTRYAELMHWF